jgi:hypothetical protein
MKITFENVSKIELTIDSSGRGSVKMSCPVEGTNGSEIELSFKSCDLEVSNNEIIIKNLYTEDSYPAVIAHER